MRIMRDAGDGGGGSAQPQEQPAVVAATGEPAHSTIPAELQPVIDNIVKDRVKRAQELLLAEQQAKAKADADAAEAKRLADEKQYQELARKHETRAQELEVELQQMRHDQLRRDAAQAAGIPQLWERLRGATPDELAEDAKGLAAMMQPAQPANGQATRQTTMPTPAPQGRQGLTDEERRARATRTF